MQTGRELISSIAGSGDKFSTVLGIVNAFDYSNERHIARGTRVAGIRINGLQLPVRVYASSDSIVFTIAGVPRRETFHWMTNGSFDVSEIKGASLEEKDQLRFIVKPGEKGLTIDGCAYGYHVINGGYYNIPQVPMRLTKMEDPVNLAGFLEQLKSKQEAK